MGNDEAALSAICWFSYEDLEPFEWASLVVQPVNLRYTEGTSESGPPSVAESQQPGVEAAVLIEDDALILRIQDGDNQAFEILVNRYRGALVGFFIKNVRDRELAEDLAQETLLRVYKQAWNYLPRGKFRGWMYRIARNLIIDSFRRRSHDALIKASTSSGNEDNSDPLTRIAEDTQSPEQLADQFEIAAMVEEELEKIPEDQKLTFTLHHYCGLTLSEIADVMETSVPTSKSRLRLTREKLSEALLRRGVKNPHLREEE